MDLFHPTYTLHNQGSRFFPSYLKPPNPTEVCLKGEGNQVREDSNHSPRCIHGNLRGPPPMPTFTPQEIHEIAGLIKGNRWFSWSLTKAGLLRETDGFHGPLLRPAIRAIFLWGKGGIPLRWLHPTLTALTLKNLTIFSYPVPSMGGLYIYLHEWWISMVNFGKYTIHGSYGYWICNPPPKKV